MKLKEWLDEWSITSLKINTGFLEMDWTPNDVDKDAAWELYVELLTRITTQPLPSKHGDEETALKSVYSLFDITRSIIKRKGRHCANFTKIAIVVLNQIIRPFTAKWHRLSVNGAFKKKKKRLEFRSELEDLQDFLGTYAQMLADMAGVENLIDLEKD